MSYFDDYKNRLEATGNSIADSLKKSTIITVNKAFKDSPLYNQVFINGINYDTRVLDGDNSREKTFLLRPETTINAGNVVLYDSSNWLVIDFFKDDIYPKAIAELCNNVLHIKTGVIKTLNGYDAMGRPITNEQETYTDFPCVVKSVFNSFNDFDQDYFNIADNDIEIAIAYIDTLTEGMTFKMYDKNYKITYIDYTIEGIIKIYADREI